MDNNEKIYESTNFIHKEIGRDIEEGRCRGGVCTRFPPEPNGYLHIGSTYAINISYSAVEKFGGKFNLRFDDTNPAKEDIEYVNSIIEDMKWMGYDFGGRELYGSDYFDQIYEWAVELIKKGKAYVCDLSPEQMKEYRGTLTEPGKDSPYRSRTVEENLELFERMKNGEFEAGDKVLRAKIDMASPNMNMRDPVIYRIQKLHHYRTGDKWCIYPMYDYAHPLQDAIEGITHSLCSAEFKDHRPLYEWVLEALEIKNPPKQREFGRMNLKGGITSKRYLRELIFGGFVEGWDDPRLLTLKGLRRRGYTPEAIKTFLNEIGVSRSESIVDVAMLEHFLREDLKTKVPNVMAVLKPLKVVISNYPENKYEYLNIDNNNENPGLGSREVPFGRVLYIEQDDFMENPPPKYHRLYPGGEVRLKGAYIIRCEEAIKDESTGEVIELRCSYDPDTKSGAGTSVKKVKGVIQWVSAEHAVKAEVRLYDRLLLPEEERKKDAADWKENLNPDSLIVLEDCYVEEFLKDAKPEDKFQFMRQGYFCVDNRHTTSEKLVFNRIAHLKDSYKK
ncbi:MAG: glutamine--tRNA ligase/YqeY domain fusion protein [Bacillota bacterium]